MGQTSKIKTNMGKKTETKTNGKPTEQKLNKNKLRKKWGGGATHKSQQTKMVKL